MKSHFTPNDSFEPELIATFGQARIVKHLDGRLELRGGSDGEREEARQWAERFLNGKISN